MLFVNRDHPIDPQTISVIREVDSLAHEMTLAYFLCGAMARDILLKHVHGIETGTATRDVDFGIAVENWTMFEAIKQKLIGTGRFKPADNMHQRLYYHLTPSSHGYPIDIIPFGGIETPANSVAWPPDQADIMNVIGYKEALANVIRVGISPGLVVPVISLPGLTVLKLFAWSDRGNSNPKDAHDLVTLLRRYLDADNRDRLYEEETKLLEKAEFDLDAASPMLLGKDVRRIAKQETLTQLIILLTDENSMNRLTTHMVPRLRDKEDPIAAAELLLKHFKAGLVDS